MSKEKNKMEKTNVNDILIVYLEAALMPNNEVLHLGKSLGYISDRQRELVTFGVNKTVKNAKVIELKPKQ